MNPLRVTLVGGPTALIELDGFRILTDPTFDGPGAYQFPHVKLEKLTGPALSAEAVGRGGKPPIIFDGITGSVGFTGFDRPCSGSPMSVRARGD